MDQELRAYLEEMEARMEARADEREARMNERVAGLETRMDERFEKVETEGRHTRVLLEGMHDNIRLLATVERQRAEPGAPAAPGGPILSVGCVHVGFQSTFRSRDRQRPVSGRAENEGPASRLAGPDGNVDAANAASRELSTCRPCRPDRRASRAPCPSP